LFAIEVQVYRAGRGRAIVEVSGIVTSKTRTSLLTGRWVSLRTSFLLEIPPLVTAGWELGAISLSQPYLSG
jgi:hypothetical protein